MAENFDSFDNFAAEYKPRIEERLEACISGCSDDCPAQLKEAMRYSLLAPGKRIRPLLVLLACDAVGGEVEEAMAAACAVEMVHAFSLIHDDLPCMDDDDIRRGQPTNHKVYGEGEALLAGDALLAYVFTFLAEKLDQEKALFCIRELSQATLSMIGGQSDDLRGVSDGADSDALEFLHNRKTGALIEASLRMGGFLGGADEESLKGLSAYGSQIGLAFQIQDDLLDTEGEEATTGKSVGKDAERGKLTFPVLLGKEESEQKAQELVEEACDSVSLFGDRARPLQDLASFVIQRRS